jgi:hypothetical protein
MSSLTNDRVHSVRKAQLLFLAALETLHTVSTLDDKHVRMYGRNLRLYKMAILLARIITCVENFEPGYVNQKHARPKYVPCMVWRKGHTGAGSDQLMNRDGNDGRNRH